MISCESIWSEKKNYKVKIKRSKYIVYLIEIG